MRAILWFLCFFQLLASVAFASDNLSFEEANRLAHAQPTDITSAYYDKWDPVNNANRLDEKDGCYAKSRGIVRQVLVLDKNGVVQDVVADSDNEKARCFRASYLHFKFPEPAFSPYYVYLEMH